MLEIRDFGRQHYSDAVSIQEDLLDKRINNQIPDTLVVFEHHPVITLGRISDKNSSFRDHSFFVDQEIPVIHTRRGGEITYHSPGQLILYPIIDLKNIRPDIKSYIDFLEMTIAHSLNLFGIHAGKNGNKRGVWVKDEKIAFIGVAFKKWVTFHGAAININNDVSPFSFINPCGEKDIKVTSVKKIAKKEYDLEKAKKIFTENFVKDYENKFCKAIQHSV